jgi:hypothetical protein
VCLGLAWECADLALECVGLALAFVDPAEDSVTLVKIVGVVTGAWVLSSFCL